jgi:hypothetical protein
MKENRMHIHKADVEPWKVTLVETGAEPQIGGRIKRVLPYLSDDCAFCLTYGDGVGSGQRALDHGQKAVGAQELGSEVVEADAGRSARGWRWRASSLRCWAGSGRMARTGRMAPTSLWRRPKEEEGCQERKRASGEIVDTNLAND